MKKDKSTLGLGENFMFWVSMLVVVVASFTGGYIYSNQTSEPFWSISEDARKSLVWKDNVTVMGQISESGCDDFYDQKYDGLRMEGNYTHPEALEIAGEYDGGGNWVCVNVREMEYDRGLRVCQHEMGHEIFARECEKNMTACEERMLG